MQQAIALKNSFGVDDCNRGSATVTHRIEQSTPTIPRAGYIRFIERFAQPQAAYVCDD
jgi:hypothetical protein